jgi:hypothetical protein
MCVETLVVFAWSLGHALRADRAMLDLIAELKADSPKSR